MIGSGKQLSALIGVISVLANGTSFAAVGKAELDGAMRHAEEEYKVARLAPRALVTQHMSRLLDLRREIEKLDVVGSCQGTRQVYAATVGSWVSNMRLAMLSPEASALLSGSDLAKEGDANFERHRRSEKCLPLPDK